MTTDLAQPERLSQERKVRLGFKRSVRGGWNELGNEDEYLDQSNFTFICMIRYLLKAEITSGLVTIKSLVLSKVTGK